MRVFRSGGERQIVHGDDPGRRDAGWEHKVRPMHDVQGAQQRFNWNREARLVPAGQHDAGAERQAPHGHSLMHGEGVGRRQRTAVGVYQVQVRTIRQPQHGAHELPRRASDAFALGGSGRVVDADPHASSYLRIRVSANITAPLTVTLQ